MQNHTHTHTQTNKQINMLIEQSHQDKSAIMILSFESQKGTITIQDVLLKTRRALSPYRLCTAIAPFWFSTKHLCILIAPFWFSAEQFCTLIAPFWLSTDDLYYSKSILTCSFHGAKLLSQGTHARPRSVI